MDPSTVSAFFDEDKFADVDLVIHIGNKRQRAIKCHKFVLGVGSPVLTQRLQNWEPPSAGALQELVIDVASEGEGQAVEDLLRFLYSKGLPAETGPLAVLQLMVMSNKLQCQLCTEACAR